MRVTEISRLTYDGTNSESDAARKQRRYSLARPRTEGRAAYVLVRRKGAIMFCNNCNNSSLWLIILIIILFGYGNNGCGNNCGCCNDGCGNNCGCNNNCGCGC